MLNAQSSTVRIVALVIISLKIEGRKLVRLMRWFFLSAKIHLIKSSPEPTTTQMMMSKKNYFLKLIACEDCASNVFDQLVNYTELHSRLVDYFQSIKLLKNACKCNSAPKS